MSDLIDRERVLNSIEAYCEWCDHHDWCPTCETNDCIQEIKNAPTIDAVPVVRCKYCEKASQRTVTDVDKTYIWCVKHGYQEVNWWCADGERRVKQ